MSSILKKRATVERTTIYEARRWSTRDGLFRVSEFKRLFEGGRKVYYVEQFDEQTGTWDYISRHREAGRGGAEIEDPAQATQSEVRNSTLSTEGAMERRTQDRAVEIATDHIERVRSHLLAATAILRGLESRESYARVVDKVHVLESWGVEIDGIITLVGLLDEEPGQ